MDISRVPVSGIAGLARSILPGWPSCPPSKSKNRPAAPLSLRCANSSDLTDMTSATMDPLGHIDHEPEQTKQPASIARRSNSPALRSARTARRFLPSPEATRRPFRCWRARVQVPDNCRPGAHNNQETFLWQKAGPPAFHAWDS